MHNPNLSPQDLYANMYAIAILLELPENLALEETFSQRLHALTYDSCESLPSHFIVDFSA